MQKSLALKTSRNTFQAGFTIVELIVVMALISVAFALAVMDLRELDDPLLNGAQQFSGFIRQVRARAISRTSAYIIRPTSGTHVVTERADTCSATRTLDSQTVMDLPSSTYFLETDWEVCFSSRGFPDANIEIEIRDQGGQFKTVEILLGGAVRILGEES